MSKLYIVPTPIGNLNDMTQRAVETLKECDLILAEDTRHSQKLMNYFNIGTKLTSYHKFNEIKRSEEVIEEILNDDKNVALISDAGTPCISDPGYEIVKAAREHGIEVIGLAGASAAIIALSIAGINTDEFTFYGFLPRKKNEMHEVLNKILHNSIKTFVIYESPKRIVKLIENIKEYMPDADLCVCKELTKIHEKSFYGKVDYVLEELRNHPGAEKGEYVVAGYNNDYKEADIREEISLYGILFDKLITKEYSIKEAVEKIVEEGIASKNDVYKASLEVKKFIENF